MTWTWMGVKAILKYWNGLELDCERVKNFGLNCGLLTTMDKVLDFLSRVLDRTCERLRLLSFSV